MHSVPEPCMCGDPDCGNCFPRYEEPDEDAAYEEWRQREIDDTIAPNKTKELP